jgi:hypothetical protein
MPSERMPAMTDLIIGLLTLVLLWSATVALVLPLV